MKRLNGGRPGGGTGPLPLRRQPLFDGGALSSRHVDHGGFETASYFGICSPAAPNFIPSSLFEALTDPASQGHDEELQFRQRSSSLPSMPTPS